MDNANLPAFPQAKDAYECQIGLTKREYIATQLMAAYITVGFNPVDINLACKKAIERADLLLKYLEETD